MTWLTTFCGQHSVSSASWQADLVSTSRSSSLGEGGPESVLGMAWRRLSAIDETYETQYLSPWHRNHLHLRLVPSLQQLFGFTRHFCIFLASGFLRNAFEIAQSYQSISPESPCSSSPKENTSQGHVPQLLQSLMREDAL